MSESTMPSEEQMRTQMFKTVGALERMANAVTDHLTADKQPCETATSESVDYGSVRTQCPRCDGLVQFKDYQRDFSSPHDTCQCGDGHHLHDLPPDVQKAFLVHFAMRAGLVNQCACGNPYQNGPHRKIGVCGCPLCHAGIEGADCVCEEAVFTGDVRIKGDLIVDGTVSTIEAKTIPGPMPMQSELDDLKKEIANHRKAIAILSTFAQFKDSFFGTKPGRAAQRLVGLKSCSCVGTGWVARDEQCRKCGTSGYLKVGYLKV